MIRLLLAVVASCATPPHQYTYPMPEIPVRITRWPERPIIECYLSDLPNAPQLAPWPEGVTDDPVHRYHVSKREHDELVRSVQDLYQLVETMRTCLRRVLEEGK